MKPTTLFAAFLHRLRFACLALALCSAPAWAAADYASLVNQAREELQNDRFIEALATAKDAVRANANDYKGHYYEGLAHLGLARFEDADAAAARALSLAPENAKPGVQKLITAINTRRQSTGGVQAADAALAEGLVGKAARLYEQAWAAGKDNPEVGMKAADLYAKRLSQPVDAARVLRQIKVAASGSAAADRANSELAKLAAPLREIAKTHVDAAYGTKCISALASLQKAEDADPSLVDIYTLRASCVFDIEELQRALKDMVKYDLAQPDALMKVRKMSKWLRNPEATLAMTDVLGSAKVEKLQSMLRESRAQYEKELAQYQEDLASYDARVQEREQEVARKQASCDSCQANCKKNHGGFWGNAVKMQNCYGWCYGDSRLCGLETKEVPKPKAPVEPD